MGAKPAVAKDAKEAGRKNPFTGQNRTKKHHAAILLAEDEKTDETISAEIKISRSTLSEWKNDPEFAAIVGGYRGEIIASALKLPIAKKHERVAKLNNLLERYERIIEERATRHAEERKDTPANALRGAFGDETPAEATTGMLVRQPKIAANGKTVVEWAFDKPLDSAIKETLKQAAQELGQIEETLNVNHTGNIYHDERLGNLTIEQMEAIDRMREGRE